MPVPTPVNSRSLIVLDRFRIPCGKCGNLNGLVYKLVRIWLKLAALNVINVYKLQKMYVTY